MRQNSSTAQLIFTVADLIAFVSSVMTLLPGDIISTGTPSGIGPLAAGDSVTVRVDGVGELTNPVEGREEVRSQNSESRIQSTGRAMKFFVDTGNQDGHRSGFVALGIVDGVTTNPSLMAKERATTRRSSKRICGIVKGPVSAEVIATDADGMIREGNDLAAIDQHVVVKVPFSKAGVNACAGAVAPRGIRVNVTLIFSPTQALLAAKVGAAYVSPFIGRLDDIATDGMDLIEEIVEIFRNYAFTTEVPGGQRAASDPRACRRRASGADVCTCPPAVVEPDVQASADRPRPRALPEGLGRRRRPSGGRESERRVTCRRGGRSLLESRPPASPSIVPALPS